jgi:hypothetical protein
MNNRSTGIILTVVTIVLCGLPGLCLCLFGGLTATGLMPYTFELNGETTTGRLPALYGFGGLCAALFLIAIPVVVGILTLRKKPQAAVTPPPPPPPTEPLPPAM